MVRRTLWRVPLWVLWGTTAACTQEVPLTTALPVISVLPDAVDFGEAVAADQSPASADERLRKATVFVANPGRANLFATLRTDDPEFGLVDPKTGDLTDELSITLERDTERATDLRFAPLTVGPTPGTLVIESNDLDRPVVNVKLTGLGRVPYAPEIDVDPVTLDFGDVALDALASDIVTITNLGDAPLTLGTTEQAGAGAFRLATRDPSGTVLLPGGSLPVLVEYTAQQTGGDSGTWTVRSDDGDEPEVTVDFQANGGGEFDYPEAVITGCPATADVTDPVAVTLSGAMSSAPGGGPLDYAWSLVRPLQTVDPSHAPMPVDEVETTFVIDAAGIWEVALTVTDDMGVSSVPAKCIVDATPLDDIYVELTWEGPTADLDVHLARDGAPFFDTPDDVSYCNPTPDWGLEGDPSDDPALARDDDDGWGPEVITLPRANDGTYLVRVHHFDDGDDGSVTATAVIYVNGVRQIETSAVLARNAVWEVGQVNWPDATFGAYAGAPFDAGGDRECDP